MHIHISICLSLQEHETETEYNLATMVENSKGVMKGDPSQFELLKVLGQGSFGKVTTSIFIDKRCDFRLIIFFCRCS